LCCFLELQKKRRILETFTEAIVKSASAAKGGIALILAVLLGVSIGVGAFTFGYAEGTSYFSSDPKACVNCHVMRKEFDSWQKSSHHAAATCVQCHLPAEGIAKLIAKAENGYHHSVAFTLQNFPEPIQIKARNSAILQNNCRRCHSDFVHDIAGGLNQKQEPTKCVHCHATVGHGEPSL
jgi:cytochrome c nitrite reductase small subunit